ncbi:MAG TPA: archease [Desulfuromonadales bacterium]|nr:archease [Desulfuromonadales bacterium]
MGTHRLLEHTADMGIEASGETIEELFAQAAYGLLEIIAGTPQALCREERIVTVEGGDAEELLVNWLNEILYLFEIRRFFPLDFEIEEVRGNRLLARVRGEPFDPQRHPVEREVKAVTYHQLRVEKTDGLWHARVYVDL